MKNLKVLVALLIVCGFSQNVSAQCQVITQATPSATIVCGDQVTIDAIGLSASPALSTDFNNSQLGPGWQSTNTMIYNNPCGPSLDGTPSAWFGNVPLPRTLTTNAFDVSCGGQICFDLDFAADDPCGCSDCEDPDLTNEGVFLQYSINGGATWVDIHYFTAVSGYANQHYQWDNYCFAIPPAAWTASTMFQWDQPSASSSVNDHWGIDNVVITPSNCGYAYDWDNIGGTQDPASQVVSPTSTTSYPVSYYDTAGVDICYDTITIVVNPFINNVTASQTVLNCQDCADLSTFITNDPAPAGYTVEWSPNDPFISDTTLQNPQVCFGDTVISQWYTSIMTNGVTGCSAMDSIEIISGACPCSIDSFAAISICAANGLFDIQGSYIYSKNPGTGTLEIEATNNSGTFTETVNGPFADSVVHNFSILGIPNDGSPTTIVIYFSDSLGCTDQIIVDPPVLPTVVGVNRGNAYCENETVQDVVVDVTGTGPWTIDYTLDGTPMQGTGATSPIVLGTTPGVYTVTYIQDVICFDSAAGTQTIVINPLPNIGAGVDVAVCEGDTVTLNGTGGNTYQWDNGVTNGVPFAAMTTTTYTVIGTDLNGCDSTDQVTVTVTPYPPAPDAIPDGGEYCTSVFIPPFEAIGTAQTITWYSDQTLTNIIGNGATFQPFIQEGTTTYYVTQSNNGCESAPDTISIFMEFCEAVIEMPNVITVTGDNVNELLIPLRLDNVQELQTTIMNRWGNVIFETNDLQINWDGNDGSGKPVNDGTYFYILNYLDVGGSEGQVHGNVQVIRP